MQLDGDIKNKIFFLLEPFVTFFHYLSNGKTLPTFALTIEDMLKGALSFGGLRREKNRSSRTVRRSLVHPDVIHRSQKAKTEVIFALAKIVTRDSKKRFLLFLISLSLPCHAADLKAALHAAQPKTEPASKEADAARLQSGMLDQKGEREVRTACAIACGLPDELKKKIFGNAQDDDGGYLEHHWEVEHAVVPNDYDLKQACTGAIAPNGVTIVAADCNGIHFPDMHGSSAPLLKRQLTQYSGESFTFSADSSMVATSLGDIIHRPTKQRWKIDCDLIKFISTSPTQVVAAQSNCKAMCVYDLSVIKGHSHKVPKAEQSRYLSVYNASMQAIDVLPPHLIAYACLKGKEPAWGVVDLRTNYGLGSSISMIIGPKHVSLINEEQLLIAGDGGLCRIDIRSGEEPVKVVSKRNVRSCAVAPGTQHVVVQWDKKRGCSTTQLFDLSKGSIDHLADLPISQTADQGNISITADGSTIMEPTPSMSDAGRNTFRLWNKTDMKLTVARTMLKVTREKPDKGDEKSS